MTAPDNRHGHHGDEVTNETDPSNDVEADLDPNEALVGPVGDASPDDTPDPDVAEVTDPDDPNYVGPNIEHIPDVQTGTA